MQPAAEIPHKDKKDPFQAQLSRVSRHPESTHFEVTCSRGQADGLIVPAPGWWLHS